MCPKRPEKGDHIGLGRILIQALVEQSLERAVVNNGQDAERPVIEFVRRQITATVGQGPVQVVGFEALSVPFPPQPRPSSGSWRRGRTRGGRARDANWRP